MALNWAQDPCLQARAFLCIQLRSVLQIALCPVVQQKTSEHHMRNQDSCEGSQQRTKFSMHCSLTKVQQWPKQKYFQMPSHSLYMSYFQSSNKSNQYHYLLGKQWCPLDCKSRNTEILLLIFISDPHSVFRFCCCSISSTPCTTPQNGNLILK